MTLDHLVDLFQSIAIIGIVVWLWTIRKPWR